jgi:hypothetical protein
VLRRHVVASLITAILSAAILSAANGIPAGSVSTTRFATDPSGQPLWQVTDRRDPGHTPMGIR